MLPPLLALCGLQQPAVWRASSAAIALVMIGYGVTYPKRRRAMVKEPLPSRRWLAIVVVSMLVIAGLVGNAIGVPYEPGIAPVAIAATWTLACGATIFVVALDAFWERPSSR